MLGLDSIKRLVPTRLKRIVWASPTLDRRRWKARPLDSNPDFELQVSKAILHICKPGWHAVDVGAHYGHMTAVLARAVGKQGRVVAFEAYPPNARLLKARVAASDLQTPIHVESGHCRPVCTRSSHLLWPRQGR